MHTGIAGYIFKGSNLLPLKGYNNKEVFITLLYVQYLHVQYFFEVLHGFIFHQFGHSLYHEFLKNKSLENFLLYEWYSLLITAPCLTS